MMEIRAFSKIMHCNHRQGPWIDTRLQVVIRGRAGPGPWVGGAQCGSGPGCIHTGAATCEFRANKGQDSPHSAQFPVRTVDKWPVEAASAGNTAQLVQGTCG